MFAWENNSTGFSPWLHAFPPHTFWPACQSRGVVPSHRTNLKSSNKAVGYHQNNYVTIVPAGVSCLVDQYCGTHGLQMGEIPGKFSSPTTNITSSTPCMVVIRKPISSSVPPWFLSVCNLNVGYPWLSALTIKFRWATRSNVNSL